MRVDTQPQPRGSAKMHSDLRNLDPGQSSGGGVQRSSSPANSNRSITTERHSLTGVIVERDVTDPLADLEEGETAHTSGRVRPASFSAMSQASGLTEGRARINRLGSLKDATWNVGDRLKAQMERFARRKSGINEADLRKSGLMVGEVLKETVNVKGRGPKEIQGFEIDSRQTNGQQLFYDLFSGTRYTQYAKSGLGVPELDNGVPTGNYLGGSGLIRRVPQEYDHPTRLIVTEGGATVGGVNHGWVKSVSADPLDENLAGHARALTRMLTKIGGYKMEAFYSGAVPHIYNTEDYRINCVRLDDITDVKPDTPPLIALRELAGKTMLFDPEGNAVQYVFPTKGGGSETRFPREAIVQQENGEDALAPGWKAVMAEFFMHYAPNDPPTPFKPKDELFTQMSDFAKFKRVYSFDEASQICDENYARAKAERESAPEQQTEEATA